MRQLGFSRKATIILLAGAAVLFAAVWVLVASVLTATPFFGRGPALLTTAVNWSTLPTPSVTRPQWANHTFAGEVNDLALHNGLLWAATNGGLIVWDLRDATIQPSNASPSQSPDPSSSQAPLLCTSAPCSVQKFTTTHGLPANRANSLAIGLDGLLWVGTANGLGRYDGRDWTTFTTTDGLPVNDIHDLAVDREGFLWAATAAGLGRYDGRTWRTFTAEGLLAPLPSNYTTALAVDGANQLWVGTDSGIVRYNGRWQTFTIADGLADNQIFALAAAADGTIWAATAAGLSRYDGREWDVVGLGMLNSQAVRALAALDATTLLLAIDSDPGGVLRLDSTTGQLSPLMATAMMSTTGAAALLVENGRLWVGWQNQQDEAAVVTLVSEEQAFDLFAPSELPSPMLHDLVWAQEALWAATGNGLVRYDGRWRRFGLADGLAGEAVRALAFTSDESDGRLWAAFDAATTGISYLEAGAERWETIACDLDTPAGRLIRNGAIAPGGTLWFASDQGVSHFDPATNQWQHFRTQDGLPDNDINDLAISQDGRIWIATPSGVAVYQERTWTTITITPVNHLSLAPNGTIWVVTGEINPAVARLDEKGLTSLAVLPPTTAVRGLAATNDGAWLATADGVAHYDGEQWAWYTVDAGLPSPNVTAIAAAPTGDVWAATSGDEQQIEIVWFDGRRWGQHPNRQPAAELLLSDLVRDVVLGPEGDVWLATAAGVNRYHDERWLAYTIDDGLPTADVGDLALAFDTVWAATGSGLARWNGSEWEPFSVTAHGNSAGVQALAVAPDGALWVALAEGIVGSLRRFDGQRWQIIPTLSERSFVRQMAFAPDGRLLARVEDADQIFFGLYDGQGWTWQLPEQLPSSIEQFAFAPDGRLWTGRGLLDSALEGDTRTAGVTVYELSQQGIGAAVATIPTAGGASSFTFDESAAWIGGPGVLYHLPLDGADSVDGAAADLESYEIPIPFSRHTFALQMTEDGRLWLTTERGIATVHSSDLQPLTNDSPSPVDPAPPQPPISNLQSPTSTNWTTFYAPPTPPPWWDSVQTLTVRPDGGILLGTSNGGTGLYTGRGYSGDLNPAWRATLPPITTLFNDADNHLWAGSAGGGLARLTNRGWQTLLPAESLTAPIQTLTVTEDSGQIWLGTTAGIVRATLPNQATDRCRLIPDSADTPILSAAADGTGGLWLGTANGAIRQGHTQETNWPNAAIPAIITAPDGSLWFVNRHLNWLTWYNPAETTEGAPRWRRVPLNQEVITAADIYTIAIAPNLTIWLGSEQGATSFNGRDWTTLTTADGLADNQVDQILAQPDGSIWFATPGGLSHYQPAP